VPEGAFTTVGAGDDAAAAERAGTDLLVTTERRSRRLASVNKGRRTNRAGTKYRCATRRGSGHAEVSAVTERMIVGPPGPRRRVALDPKRHGSRRPERADDRVGRGTIHGARDGDPQPPEPFCFVDLKDTPLGLARAASLPQCGQMVLRCTVTCTMVGQE